MIGDVLSLLSGVALMVSGSVVMWAYRPSGGWGRTRSGVLGFAIFLGFFSAVANTLYWQVWGQIAVEYWGIWTVETLRYWGDFMDVTAKGSGTVSAILHLWALRKKEREE